MPAERTAVGSFLMADFAQGSDSGDQHAITFVGVWKVLDYFKWGEALLT